MRVFHSFRATLLPLHFRSTFPSKAKQTLSLRLFYENCVVPAEVAISLSRRRRRWFISGFPPRTEWERAPWKSIKWADGPWVADELLAGWRESRSLLRLRGKHVETVKPKGGESFPVIRFTGRNGARKVRKIPSSNYTFDFIRLWTSHNRGMLGGLRTKMHRFIIRRGSKNEQPCVSMRLLTLKGFGQLFLHTFTHTF